MTSTPNPTATTRADALLPVLQFVDGMNRGDLKAAFAACRDEMSIIDNVAPYAWHGKGACEQWAAAQEADATRKGMTDVEFRIGEAARLDLNRDSAYAVLPASYTFKTKGAPGRVEGTLTVALQKDPTGWRLSGFAFAER